jgi:hypothetical protein
MTKRKMIKGQTMIYKTLDRKLKIDQREPHYKPGIHSGHPEESAVPALLVAPVVLLLSQIQ